MEMSVKLSFCIALLSVLLLLRCSPTAAWYKQVTAGPSYYSVGRASGLLSGSGFRRFPFARRAERDSSDNSREPSGNNIQDFIGSLNFFFNTPICIKDVTPSLQSCELDQGVRGLFKCKADVFLSLDSTDCAEY